MACNGQEYLCSPKQMPQSSEFLRQHWYLYWGAGRLGCFGVMERTQFLDTWDRCDQDDGCSVVPCASSRVPCGSPILSFNLTQFSLMLLSHHGRAEWSPGFQHLTHGWAAKLCHALPWISKTPRMIWNELGLSALGYPLFVLATGGTSRVRMPWMRIEQQRLDPACLTQLADAQPSRVSDIVDLL